LQEHPSEKESLSIEISCGVCVCGKELYRRDQKHCSYACAERGMWKVKWDSVDLQKELQEKSVLQLSKELGVSDNAIHKRLKKLGLKQSKRRKDSQ
jgi:hypothetical protein